jgi:hypothetical protein
MLRVVACAAIAIVALIGVAQAAGTKPTAPEKMASPADKRKMKACEAKAAAQQVPMAERAKFLMDCTRAK